MYRKNVLCKRLYVLYSNSMQIDIVLLIYILIAIIVILIGWLTYMHIKVRRLLARGIVKSFEDVWGENGPLDADAGIVHRTPLNSVRRLAEGYTCREDPSAERDTRPGSAGDPSVHCSARGHRPTASIAAPRRHRTPLADW